MSLALFHEIISRKIENLFYEQIYLCLKELILESTCVFKILDITLKCWIGIFLQEQVLNLDESGTPYHERSKNSHNIFVTLMVESKVLSWSKQAKIVALVKWLIKKVLKRIQEERHLPATQL